MGLYLLTVGFLYIVSYEINVILNYFTERKSSRLYYFFTLGLHLN